jgi:hypothetical protein
MSKLPVFFIELSKRLNPIETWTLKWFILLKMRIIDFECEKNHSVSCSLELALCVWRVEWAGAGAGGSSRLAKRNHFFIIRNLSHFSQFWNVSLASVLMFLIIPFFLPSRSRQTDRCGPRFPEIWPTTLIILSKMFFFRYNFYFKWISLINFMSFIFPYKFLTLYHKFRTIDIQN